jgi:UDP-N-acetylglucosamine 2-epimerase (non-hydrolysing)
MEIMWKQLNNLSHREDIKYIYISHPSLPDSYNKLNENIILLEPLSYENMVHLIVNCYGIISDSGGLQEESTALDIPCFTLRENTERPSTLIENHGTNQLIGKISEIELKPCKGSMELWDGKSSEKIKLYCLQLF